MFPFFALCIYCIFSDIYHVLFYIKRYERGNITIYALMDYPIIIDTISMT